MFNSFKSVLLMVRVLVIAVESSPLSAGLQDVSDGHVV